MDFDHVLEKCGSFGRYQKCMLLLFGYSNILSSMHYFSQTIISFTPQHWCYHEKLENLSFTQIESIYAQTARPACTLLDDVIDDKIPVIAETGHCHEWIYKYEKDYKSVTTELNWVCDDAHKLAVGQSLLYIGSVCGTILFGFLADWYGRLPALILSTITGAIGDFMTSFADSLPAFAIYRFIGGLSTDTLFYLIYIMVFEYLCPKKRTFGLNITTAVFYCSGLMLSPWYAVWVGTWRKYLWIVSLPALGVLLYPIVLCESAQWLMTNRKYDAAVRSLKYVAKFNGNEVEESVFTEFVVYYEHKLAETKKSSTKRDSFVGMFRSPRLRKFAILLIIKSIIITLAFDIISRNMEGLGSSPFMLFSFTSIVYVPAGLTIILLQNKIGRKGMACSCLLVGGIITVVTGFIIAFFDRNEYTVLLAIMVGLGRYGAVVAYDAEAQYAAELIPTSVRAQGVSDIHVVGYAFSFLSAYIIYFGNYYKPLPSIFVGIIMLMGAGLCLALPETLNKKLPDNLSEGELLGLYEKWYYFPCLKRRNKGGQEQTNENR